MTNEIFDNRTAPRRKHRFGVKLHAVHVVACVAQSHDPSVGVFGRHFETVRQRVASYDPRVVASYLHFRFQSVEDIIGGQQPDRGLHSVIDVFEVFERPAECLADRLLAEADPENAFFSAA